jgi:protein gp37
MSKIEWTDKTSNPIKEVGGGNYCIPISKGCKNCYASVLNSRGTRFGGNGRKFGVRPEGHPEMTLNTEMLAKWARMRKPKRHFVGSMTDIFGEWVPDEMIFDLFDAMADAPMQTFQILTKRPKRLSLCDDWLDWVGLSALPQNAEDQKRFDTRLIHLIRSNVRVRFLSIEPLLGPINLLQPDDSIAHGLIHWVIIGGESGPNARPMKLEWVEYILRQCETANIPAFVKQLGSHWAKEVGASHSKGGDPSEWPAELRARMFPGDN